MIWTFWTWVLWICWVNCSRYSRLKFKQIVNSLHSFSMYQLYIAIVLDHIHKRDRNVTNLTWYWGFTLLIWFLLWPLPDSNAVLREYPIEHASLWSGVTLLVFNQVVTPPELMVSGSEVEVLHWCNQSNYGKIHTLGYKRYKCDKYVVL